MLDQNPILVAHDVGGDPIHRGAEPRKSSVHNYEISVGCDRSWLVLERCWEGLEQIEQSVAARRDVSAVLDVVRRPKLLSGRVVPLVKQGVECVEHQRCATAGYGFSFVHTALTDFFAIEG